jgi:hypothetical protein
MRQLKDVLPPPNLSTGEQSRILARTNEARREVLDGIGNH